jgi:hypothetical protein
VSERQQGIHQLKICRKLNRKNKQLTTDTAKRKARRSSYLKQSEEITRNYCNEYSFDSVTGAFGIMHILTN